MRRSDFALNLLLGVLSTCALVTTALVVRRELFAAHANPETPQAVPDWRAFAHDGHRMGRESTPVTIVVFSDYQCPFCAATMKELELVRNRYPNDVAVVYRHFPVQGHRQAIPAVRASECASDQARFEEFTNVLFASQDSIGIISWEDFAKRARVPNLNAFNACNAGHGAIPALARDTLAANRLRVRGTPTLLVNEQLFEGKPPENFIEAKIAELLHARTGHS